MSTCHPKEGIEPSLTQAPWTLSAPTRGPGLLKGMRNMQDGGISGSILKTLNAQKPKGDFQNLKTAAQPECTCQVLGSTPGSYVYNCER